jgi:NAD(P)H-dependent FMN reductase
MSTRVTREHRKLVAAALGHAAGDADAERWVDTGQLPDSRYSWPYDEAPPDVNALAQAIADAEARGRAAEQADICEYLSTRHERLGAV